MAYIIDGHNLIPKVHGLSLQRLDDELELIKRLQTFARIRRQSLEVYFDKAAPGRAGTRNFGTVKAVFVAENSSADAAIRDRLHRMGRKARGWKVVSSDRQVQAEVRSCQAEVVSSDAFAVQLEDVLIQSVKSPGPNTGLTDAEVDDWLRMFNQPPPDEKP